MLCILCLVTRSVLAATPDATEPPAIRVNITAGSVEQALKQVSELFNANILYPAGLLSSQQHLAVKGHYSFRQVLTLLLVEQPVQVQWLNAQSVILTANEQSSSTQPDSNLQQSAQAMDELIVTGTRVAARTRYDSMSAIDILTTPDGTGAEDLLNTLAFYLPSFTAFRLPLSDGRIFNRSFGLRGLNSDHTLILVNGKRRHRSAFVETEDGHPIDLSKIPSHAIKRIEVMRDGASAQYGSDALAGVINVILEDGEQSAGFMQYGQYFQGDGVTWRGGMRLGWQDDEDFSMLSLSGYRNTPTSRGTQPQDAVLFAQQHPELKVPNPVQRWGLPEQEGLQLAFNTQQQVGEQFSAFAFGTLAQTYGVSDFNWRNPDTNLVYQPSSLYPDFSLLDIYPVGFTPRFGQRESDIALHTGIRSFPGAHPQAELSLGFGQNRIRYFLNNSINASLGPHSPTAFHPGDLTQQEVTLDASINQQTRWSAKQLPINLATGLQFRSERYRVQAGDPASFAVGPAAIEGLPSGANGFPGYSPLQAGSFTQQGLSAYADMDITLSESLRLNLAARYESYSLFSSMLRGKLALWYELAPGIMLRTTLSNGFRAPTAGQVFSERTSQSLNSSFDAITTSGRFSPNGAVAEVLTERPEVNIRPLRAEKSVNISAGMGFSLPGQFDLTLDLYRIDLSERFGLSPTYSLTRDEQQRLAALSPHHNYQVANVRFFQNIFDTRTSGLDLVLTRSSLLGSGQLLVSAAYNYNRTQVTGGELMDNQIRRTQQEQGVPQHRASLSASYLSGPWEWRAGWRYIGSWQDQAISDSEQFQQFSPLQLFDLSLTYLVDAALSVKFGIENLFDTYPDEASLQSNRGLRYSRNSPYDTDGGQWYLRTNFAF
ncbi:TonB-dependent receptor plug domain-containing protein [Bowmanella yangjiangensis]|uniref:TonB-dependent receptor n=1 Tax=Bowmanella yangjiangensis TaxID=2811230 RepID=A0ABS3D0K4_9ALTE|nr:TonB-dependent receptor [Bowmanella yangjiangensis]MBN7822161.1 TonB-dependent receptor [Bowmanella yangjiangensis]